MSEWAGLLLHSPVPLTKELRERVESLGTVTHLYAPNTFHHLWLGEWAREFPGACVHGPSALRKKRPDLRIDRAHDVEPPGSLGTSFDEVHIGGFALEESVLVHRRSRWTAFRTRGRLARASSAWRVTRSSA